MSEKVKVVSVRMLPEEFESAKALSPEGNISMWIRSLIRKEIKSQQAQQHRQQTQSEMEHELAKIREAHEKLKDLR
jgi:hypothetical protein